MRKSVIVSSPRSVAHDSGLSPSGDCARINVNTVRRLLQHVQGDSDEATDTVQGRRAESTLGEFVPKITSEDFILVSVAKEFEVKWHIPHDSRVMKATRGVWFVADGDVGMVDPIQHFVATQNLSRTTVRTLQTNKMRATQCTHFFVHELRQSPETCLTGTQSHATR